MAVEVRPFGGWRMLGLRSAAVTKLLGSRRQFYVNYCTVKFSIEVHCKEISGTEKINYIFWASSYLRIFVGTRGVFELRVALETRG